MTEWNIEKRRKIGFGTPSYAADVYKAFFFEKNLRGDIVAIYNEDGVKIGTYTYDAWGNFTVNVSSGVTALDVLIVRNYNPYHYRGYYFDAETEWYYLQSRYYNPEWGRFINADILSYLGADGSSISYNLFAYCSNNPVMGYDPSGHWDWGKFWDIVVTGVSIIAGVAVGIVTFSNVTAETNNPVAGVSAGMAAEVATTSVINNTVNAIYYTFAANDTSNVTPTSYTDGYVDRWDRLDYTKAQTGEQYYNVNAWRYYSEYNLHMYGWYLTGWALDKNIPVVSKLANKFKSAEVEVNAWDDRWYVNIFTVAVGVLGG